MKFSNRRLLLASASPRRRELLTGVVLFDCIPSVFSECAEGLSQREMALFNAKGKAEEVFFRYPDRVVLGADTVVGLNGEIFLKPKDEADARRMLRTLSGQTHAVITGVCIKWAEGEQLFAEETLVTFETLNEDLISRYLESGLYLGKAGAYGIQDGFPLVKEIKGSYTNVVGLPMEQVQKALTEVGLC